IQVVLLLCSKLSCGDPGSVPGSGRSPGEGNCNPLRHTCLENPMDGGAWQAAVHGVAKNRLEPGVLWILVSQSMVGGCCSDNMKDHYHMKLEGLRRIGMSPLSPPPEPGPPLDKLEALKYLGEVRFLSVGFWSQLPGSALSVSSALAGRFLSTAPPGKYKLYTFSECFCHAEQSSITGILGSVLPYYVATKLAKIRKPTLDKPSSETFVKSAIKTIGMQPRTNGYFIHSLMASVVSILPSWLYFKATMNVNKSVRAHYFKKMKKN
ncbi:hypothetical protein FD754_016763, partial [Muntiacus muntjak]